MPPKTSRTLLGGIDNTLKAKQDATLSTASSVLETYRLELGRIDRHVLTECVEACDECAQACTACADACLSQQSVQELAKSMEA